MNIRQNCIFSFEDALKLQPKSKLERIITTLDLEPVLAKFSQADKSKVGPKPYPVYAMLNALIAMRIENISNFTQTGRSYTICALTLSDVSVGSRKIWD